MMSRASVVLVAVGLLVCLGAVGCSDDTRRVTSPDTVTSFGDEATGLATNLGEGKTTLDDFWDEYYEEYYSYYGQDDEDAGYGYDYDDPRVADDEPVNPDDQQIK